MTYLRRALLLGLTSLSFGCGSTIIVASPPDTDAGAAIDTSPSNGEAGTIDPMDAGVVVVDRPTPLLDAPRPPLDTGGRTCRSDADCGRAGECVGPIGCGVPWTCQPRSGRVCTGDLAPYCGCDGRTFRGSSSCPPGPYLHVGPCDTPPPLDGGVVTPMGCELPDGRICPLNDTCRVTDGCTICRCTARGLECASTGMCRDAGPVRDVATRDAGSACSIRGVTCPVGSLCRVGGNLSCFCYAPDRYECRPDTADAGTVPTDTGTVVRDAVATPDGPTVVDAGSVCASQDARGEGVCDLFLGVYWMSNRCVGVSGCRCVGADCGSSFASFPACEEAHAVCRR